MRPYPRRTRMHDMLDQVRMTQRMLSSEVGVEQSAMSLWMSGKRLPADESIEKIAQVWQVDFGTLKATFLAETLSFNYSPAMCSSIAKILQEITEERERTG